MSAEDGPAWLEPATSAKDNVVLLNNTDRGVAQLKGDVSSSSSEGSSNKCYQIRIIVQWALRIATMMICVLMACTALVGLSSVNGIEATGTILTCILSSHILSIIIWLRSLPFYTSLSCIFPFHILSSHDLIPSLSSHYFLIISLSLIILLQVESLLLSICFSFPFYSLSLNLCK